MLLREQKVELSALGIKTFLPKPVVPQVLIEEVWQLLNSSEGRQVIHLPV
jgi:hypothetical protein